MDGKMVKVRVVKVPELGGIYQVKVWVDNLYKPGVGFIKDACEHSYVSEWTQLKQGFVAVWAHFCDEFGDSENPEALPYYGFMGACHRSCETMGGDGVGEYVEIWR